MNYTISADDGGLHPSIDEAILSGVREKIISEFSVVACGKNFLNFSEILRENNIREVGFHACFTDGETSLTGISSLTDRNSRFISKSKLILKSMIMPTKMKKSLYKELRKQIEEIRRQGLTITHINSHQHLHVLPFFHQTFLRLSLELEAPIRIPKVVYFSSRITTIPLAIFARFLHKRSHTSSVPHYMGVGFEHSGSNNRKTIAGYIQLATREHLEFFCHPGTSNEEIDVQYSHWGYDWEAELRELKICVSEQNYPVKLRNL